MAVTRVVVVGGGMAGYTVAKDLEKHRAAGVEVTVINPKPYYTYLPFLPEVAGGHIDPQNVTVQLRSALPHAKVVLGAMTAMDPEAKTITVTGEGGKTTELPYDQAVIAMGSVTRTFPTPGLAEFGVGFKTVEEAVFTRSTLLANIAEAAATEDRAARRKLMTVVFVGGGYTGVEAMCELLEAARAAVRSYDSLSMADLRFVLVEALDRVAPEVGPQLSAWTLKQLRHRGIDVRLKTTMPSCEDGVAKLSDGEEVPAGLIAWTAGVKPNPSLADTGLPLGPRGHVNVKPTLQVAQEDGTPVDGVFALGDNAQVPDLVAEKQPAWCVPNAQHAVRQAQVAALNVVAASTGAPLTQYRHESIGTVASYGLGHGAANVKGIKLTELPAWFMHRAYHVYAMPTLTRRWRILSGWFSNDLGSTDVTSLAAVEDPRAPIRASLGVTAPSKG
jgi:NADH:ubiquinone reductase (H+-translocating)